MKLNHRPVKADDIKTICDFPQNAQELFFIFPKAHYPLTEAQLIAAITQRFDSTVVEIDGAVVGFANFIELNAMAFAVSAMSSSRRPLGAKAWPRLS